MNTAVILAGLGLLLVLTAAVGMLRGARRIAAGRSMLAAEHADLLRWEKELIDAAESRECAGCRVLRGRADLRDQY